MDPHRNLKDLGLPKIRECMADFKDVLRSENALSDYASFLKHGHSAAEYKEKLTTILKQIAPKILKKIDVEIDENQKLKNQLKIIDKHYSARSEISVTYKNRTIYSVALKLVKMDETIQHKDLMKLLQSYIPKACPYLEEQQSPDTVYSRQDVMELLEALPSEFPTFLSLYS